MPIPEPLRPFGGKVALVDREQGLFRRIDLGNHQPLNA
jgi:hypothetical protein